VEEKKSSKSLMKRILGQKNDTASKKTDPKEPTEEPEAQASQQDTQMKTQEAKQNEPTDPKTATNTIFNVGRFFVKKMDFDATDALTVFNSKTKSSKEPEVKIEMNLKNTPMENDAFEVDLSIKATATLEGKPFYMGSVEQAGFFTAKNFNPQQLDFLLKSYCPNLLFPYARENMANVMQRSGFKPLELPPIDFGALYQKSLEENKNRDTH